MAEIRWEEKKRLKSQWGEQLPSLMHFTPTTEQRKQFAKSGWAMPDGSFYIRPVSMGGRSDLDNAINAVGRATPNADESEVARRNSVRRHIIKRAGEIGLSDMIPDTWNSNGSLKQSEAEILIRETEEFLAHWREEAPTREFLSHFGVRGMKWGVRRSDNTGTSGSRHPVSPESGKSGTGLTVHLQQQLEMHTRVAQGRGSWSDRNNARRQLQYERATKGSAKDWVPTRRISDEEVTSFSAGKARELQALKTRAQSDKLTAEDRRQLRLTTQPEDTLRRLTNRPRRDKEPAFHSDVDEFLEHFGVLGMKWGVHRSQSAGNGGGRPPVSPEAARARGLQTQVKRGGTQSLSNKDLQDLVTRMNLEKQYSQLSGQQVGQGKRFVTGLLKDSGRELAKNFIVKNAPIGAAWVAKKIAKKAGPMIVGHVVSTLVR